MIIRQSPLTTIVAMISKANPYGQNILSHPSQGLWQRQSWNHVIALVDGVELDNGTLKRPATAFKVGRHGGSGGAMRGQKILQDRRGAKPHDSQI
jgi:hypothetical protein